MNMPHLAYTRTESILRLDHVSLQLGSKLILRDLSIEIRDVERPDCVQGQVVCFLGPSGVGKSQTARLIAGLQQPTQGSIVLRDGTPVRKGLVGMVPQNYPLFEYATVAQNFAIAARQGGFTATNATGKLAPLLETFALHDYLNDYPAQLSGGTRQRVAIVRQLLCSDHYIVLDEPFSGLDPRMKQRACDLITQVAGLDSTNCYSADTECLTGRGWVRGLDLKDDDSVAVLDPGSDDMIYAVPSRIVRMHYDGPMHHWENRLVDAMVTPNHRMYVKTQRRSEWSFVESAALEGKARHHWRVSGGIDGGATTVRIPSVPYTTNGLKGFSVGSESQDFPAVVFAKWLGYWIAEGSIKKGRHSITYDQTSVEPHGLSYEAQDMLDSIDDLQSGYVGIQRKKAKTVSGRSVWSYTIHNKSLRSWLETNCGTDSKTKKLPREVFGWSREARLELLRTYIDGDGHEYKTGLWGCTSSQQLANDIQELAVTLGLRCRVKSVVEQRPNDGSHYGKNGDVIYMTYFSKTKKTAVVESSALKIEPYSGDVWCVDVGGRAFVTRRAGKVALHGNTIILVTHDVTEGMSVADTVWLMGLEQDSFGNYQPGARIVEQYDLAEAGLCWHPDIIGQPEFMALVAEVKKRFATLVP